MSKANRALTATPDLGSWHDRAVRPPKLRHNGGITTRALNSVHRHSLLCALHSFLCPCILLSSVVQSLASLLVESCYSRITAAHVSSRVRGYVNFILLVIRNTYGTISGGLVHMQSLLLSCRDLRASHCSRKAV